MTRKYYGQKICGTPHHIDVWYDRSVRTWWVQVYDKKGMTMDLEYRGGMRHGFVFDVYRRDLAEREAKEISALLKIPYKFCKR